MKDELFDPLTHILYFGTIIDKLCDHHYYNSLDTIISDIKRITGAIEIDYQDLKNYKEKGQSINTLLNANDLDFSLNIIKKYFGPFIKLPIFIFLKLEMFGNRLGKSLDGGYLNSNNIPLIDKVKDYLQKNIKSDIIEFLSQNDVLFIFNDSKKDKIDLQKEYKYSNDKCNICSYRKFELVDLDNKEENITESNLQLFIDDLYFLMEYGKITESIVLFEKLLNFTKTTNDLGLTYFHLVYNFKRFYDYYIPILDDENIKNLLSNLQKYIDEDIWVLTIANLSNKETRLIAEYYIKLFHIENQSKTLRILDTANNIINFDKTGGDSSTMINRIEIEIYNYIKAIFSHTNHNKIIFDTEYSNAKLVLNKSLELLLSLSSIKNPRSYNIVQLNKIYLELIINHINYYDLEKILKEYNDKALVLNNLESKSLIHTTCVMFLSNILLLQRGKIGIHNKNEHSFGGINNRINNAAQNIATIYSTLEFTDSEQEGIIEIFINLFSHEGVFYPKTYSIINELLHNKQKQIPTQQLEKIKILWNKFPNFFDKIDFSAITNIDQYDENDSLDNLTDVLITRESEIPKKRFKELIENKLDAKFSFYHYRLGVIFDVTSFKKYENKALAHLEKVFAEEKKYKDPFRSSYESNLVDFIELLYKEKIDTKVGIYQNLIPEKNEYIIWLMDLANYPQENFNPYWVILNYSSIFYKEFAKHIYIKDGISEYLKKNDQPRLTQIYFQYFSKQDIIKNG